MPTALRAAILAGVLANLSLPALATDIAGIHFDDRTAVAGSDLALNGAGLRTRFMVKVYAMGLYLPRRADTADAVASQPGPKRIQIVTLRELSAEQFADALLDGLKKNHSEAEFAKLQARSDEFRTALLGLKSAPSGTQIRLEWLPAYGTRLYVGNEIRGKDIPGEDFYRALLRIWLGEKPADGDLKSVLLGKG
ncbi:chalcone isomerase family protein [Zoogloea sp.]|uniref:chalcone isomerase family protein n=1 Tax=Zoogloea sp. TaxID=49181 RepID=UPI0035B3B05A